MPKKKLRLSFNDLKDKRIGVENGTTYQKYLQDEYPQLKIVTYDSYQNIMIDLKNGRVDGMFGDSAVINTWLNHNMKLGIGIEKVIDIKYFGLGLGIAVHKKNKILLEELNISLKKIKANGTWKKINDKWFSS